VNLWLQIVLTFGWIAVMFFLIWAVERPGNVVPHLVEGGAGKEPGNYDDEI
jgi:hypothetical protein